MRSSNPDITNRRLVHPKREHGPNANPYRDDEGEAAIEPRHLPGLTRRRLLELAGASLAAQAIAPETRALARALKPYSWPHARLTARDARRVAEAQFMPAAQLLEWHRELDRVGLRATGSPAHERYIDTLRGRLERVGVGQLHYEPVAHRRWLADSWALHVDTGAGFKPIGTAAYVPYSGGTPPGGVTGPLVLVDPSTPPAPGSLRGKVALLTLPLTSLTYAALGDLAYRTYDPGHILSPTGIYARAWLSITTLITILDGLVSAQAAACVVVLQLPADAAHGAYYPYDGNIRPVPGVFVDQATGAHLHSLAAAGGRARLELRSQTKDMHTRNLIGLIPGAADELVLLHSHTDGPNAIEDNGPNSIVAISQYLTRLPRRSLPRSVMVLLTTGHFAGGAGVKAFVARHRHTTLRRTAAALTLEHLGALEWNPQPDGHSRLTGHNEAGSIFAPETSALVDPAYRALQRAHADPTSVLHPFVASPGSPDGHGWPAEGTQLWTMGAIPTANFITGPTYLLNWGIPTIDKLDLRRMRNEAMAFTEMLIALSREPRWRLRRLDLLAK